MPFIQVIIAGYQSFFGSCQGNSEALQERCESSALLEGFSGNDVAVQIHERRLAVQESENILPVEGVVIAHALVNGTDECEIFGSVQGPAVIAEVFFLLLTARILKRDGC